MGLWASFPCLYYSISAAGSIMTRPYFTLFPIPIAVVAIPCLVPFSNSPDFAHFCFFFSLPFFLFVQTLKSEHWLRLLLRFPPLAPGEMAHGTGRRRARRARRARAGAWRARQEEYTYSFNNYCDRQTERKTDRTAPPESPQGGFPERQGL